MDSCDAKVIYKLLGTPSDPVGFQLYGMNYVFTERQVHGAAGKTCKCILASEVHKRRLSDIIHEGTNLLVNLELLAVDCIRAFYGHMEFGIDETNLVVHGDNKYVVSTERGTVAILTDKGGIYNLIAKDPRDVFVFKRYLDEFPKNYGIVELGSRTYAFYEKLGYDLEDVDEVNCNVSMMRYNFEDSEQTRDVSALAKKYGFTIWSISNGTVPIHSNTEQT